MLTLAQFIGILSLFTYFIIIIDYGMSVSIIYVILVVFRSAYYIYTSIEYDTQFPNEPIYLSGPEGQNLKNFITIVFVATNILDVYYLFHMQKLHFCIFIGLNIFISGKYSQACVSARNGSQLEYITWMTTPKDVFFGLHKFVEVTPANLYFSAASLLSNFLSSYIILNYQK